MEFRNIAEIRAQAEEYLRRSESASDEISKLRWRTLAEACLLMADNIGKRDVYDAIDMSKSHNSVQQQGKQH